jgi:hypothetical protein
VHAAYARLGPGQRINKGWTAGDQLIASSGFGITLKNLVVVAVRFKMAYYPVEAVKNSQNRLF